MLPSTTGRVFAASHNNAGNDIEDGILHNIRADLIRLMDYKNKTQGAMATYLTNQAKSASSRRRFKQRQLSQRQRPERNDPEKKKNHLFNIKKEEGWREREKKKGKRISEMVVSPHPSL